MDGIAIDMQATSRESEYNLIKNTESIPDRRKMSGRYHTSSFGEK